MKQLSGWSLSLSLVFLAGCSSASGPTFNAYTVTAADGSRLHQVECHGIFEGPATCMKVAQRICQGEPVRPVQKVGRLLPDNDESDVTRRLTFACGGAPDTPAAAATQPAAPVAQTVDQFVLQTDTLFAFGQSSLASISPGGAANLEQVIARIKQRRGVQSISVVGHTDRLGPDAVNQSLSLARAETIREYMINHGLDGEVIHATGVGSRDSTTQCPDGGSRAVIACLQPDRRVSIEVRAQ
ncbi:OmpA family protein [Paraburkholderia aspalathi]|uniref:OmpA family protein n=1 Tax=Paraburkholderia aspalathi TaxID=1324617 RepID=UPI00190C29D6|nr:OmpA family protein [Paraburkholderia aspalathi]MBK3839315.1 OmpA family protein [Paraburkholderia aspalathi]MCP2088068.1 outer membrane protein OmpA-like peptidoglycan-associated protein [Paraburkholderia sediminicola]CAE6726532.1 Outer membrane protein A [Paraburkholderia aspalathi]CAE6757773.1 Outer membrane protein A [Paraburkholderia aspalathi]